MATSGSTYGAESAIRESLWNDIKSIEKKETYVTSTSGRVSVGQKVHSWTRDPITATTSVTGVAEGADTSFAIAEPTTHTNYTQIIEKGFKVTSTRQNSEFAAWKNDFAHQQAKKMKEWKNELEWSVLCGTIGSGTASAARRMGGIVRLSSMYSTVGSVVSLTSDLLNAYLGNAYDNGADHEVVLVGRALKERISMFTVGNTRNIDAQDETINARVSVYESDHGTQKIIKHRYVNSAGMGGAGTLTNTLVTYIPDYVKIGFLDEPHYEDRPAAGYYKAGSIVGEATVQVADPYAVQVIDQLS